MDHLKPHVLILIIICVLGTILRFYNFTTPLADWHSFRQADTASVAREFIKQGLNPLVPKYHDLSNIQSGLDNPQGYRMVEFPLISAAVALTHPLTSHWLELHQWYRLTSIIFSIMTIILIYYLATLIDRKLVGLSAALVYALLPYNIYYSRTILPEIPMLFFILLAMVSFLTYINRNKTWLLTIFATSFAIALLLKPTAIFFLLPLVVYALLQQKITLRQVGPWFTAMAITVVPLILWRYWIQQFPEGIPVNRWLLNGNGIRFKPAFFRWIFAERVSALILGYWGIVLFAVGYLFPNSDTHTEGWQYLKSKFTRFTRALLHPHTLQPDHLSAWFYNSWTLAMLMYLIIFATGNVQHDYYQIILLPLVSIMVGRGLIYLYNLRTLTAYAIAAVSFVFMVGFSWYQISGYFHINNWAMVHAGQAVDRLTPPDALVIAPYMGDTAFLYQTNRRGWPLGFDIENKISQGASYYVSTNYDDEARELESQYQLVSKTDEYILIQLQ